MNPYQNLPSKCFWRPAISQVSPFDIADLYTKKFEIEATDTVATAGSCFAQHIARRMSKAGFQYCDFEPPPPVFPLEMMTKFNYGVYSARYCNIYTVRQLLQTFQRAFGLFVPEQEFWIDEDGVRDQFRPLLEPEPFASVTEARNSREAHYESIRRLLQSTNLFIFTMGLTEAWEDARDGSVLPVCPGTQGGTFDPATHRFVNFRTDEISADFRKFLDLSAKINPSLKILLTVSPVPLTATASGNHVLAATTYSKSVLRAVAGELADTCDNIAYFPSYEIISSAPFKGIFFEPNMRSVNEHGVDFVMANFFQAHPPVRSVAAESPTEPAPRLKTETDVICEEMLLEMYGR